MIDIGYMLGATSIAYGLGIATVIGVGYWLKSGEQETDALVAPHPAELTLTGTRCVGGHVRHLFLNTPRCTRDGCRAENPKNLRVVDEPVLATTEGQSLDVVSA